MMVDLDNVDPRGRLDVLVYKLGEHLTKKLEQKHGLEGIWDSLKPHVGKVINEHVSRIELPTEAKIILQIIQANPQKLL